MIEEDGLVVALNGQRAWVQTIRVSTCESCSAKASCGQSALSKLSQGKANQVLMDNALGARVGDTVTIGIAEEALLQASFWVYLVPLLMMLVVAVGVQALWQPPEFWVVLSGGGGLAAGFFIARRISNEPSNCRFEPTMLRFKHISTESLKDSLP